MNRPAGISRLWHILGASQACFQVVSSPHNTVFHDDVIHKISMTRGTALRGLSKSAGSIDLKGTIGHTPSDASQRIRIELTAHARACLIDLGIPEKSSTYRRFLGRVAAQEITDNGDTRPATTTLSVQDWAALAVQVDQGGLVFRDTPSIHTLLESFLDRAGTPVTIESWGSTWHWVDFPADPDVTAINVPSSDVVGKYAADSGVLIRITRDGRGLIYSHDHMRHLAEEWQFYWPDTLLRSQVQRPISWAQPFTVSTEMSYSKQLTDGTIINGTVTVGNPGYTVRAQHLDLTHIVEIGTGLGNTIAAQALENSPSEYRVETATIDVLALIERGTPADLAMASRLINAEHGECIALGWDWPPEVVGLNFIKSITETITPDAWTFQLDLVPTNHVTGLPVPNVQGRTWNSAYPPQTKWSVPQTATWATAPQET